jgi:hypothetical protein
LKGRKGVGKSRTSSVDGRVRVRNRSYVCQKIDDVGNRGSCRIDGVVGTPVEPLGPCRVVCLGRG